MLHAFALVTLAVFPEPESLQPAIRFWQDIFMLFDEDQAVLHDREDHSLAWHVVQLPRSNAGRVDERPVQAAVADLQERLGRLSKAPFPLDALDRHLLAAAGTADKLVGAAARVRSQRGLADRFKTGFARAKPYLAQIEREFTKLGLPAGLASLCFVESTFQPHARSSAGAAGIWQLMPQTARELGLRVSRHRDDRFDIMVATRAAAKLLQQNHRQLGTWPLAITAYNHGAGGMRRAVRQVGSTEIVDLIERYRKPTWGFASQNFYAEFLAAGRALHELRNPGASEQARLQATP